MTGLRITHRRRSRFPQEKSTKWQSTSNPCMLKYISSVKRHLNEYSMFVYWNSYIFSHLMISTLLHRNEKINGRSVSALSLCRAFSDSNVLGLNPPVFTRFRTARCAYAWIGEKGLCVRSTSKPSFENAINIQLGPCRWFMFPQGLQLLDPRSLA